MSAADNDDDHPDAWPPGLHFAGKRLNIRTVTRAAEPGEVLPVCLSHNLRTGNDDHRHRSRIDPARTGANEVLRGPACPLVAAELVRSVLEELGIVPARRDTIMGVELVFQPPDVQDSPAFWSECLRWVAGRYQHIVSAVVHRDQSRPHMHVITLAVADGRLAGNDLTSGPRQFPIQRVEFMKHVFEALGMRPNRRAADPLKRLALSTGKGAKTHAAAARRDAKLTREAGADWVRPDVCIGVAAADVHRGCPPNGPTPMHRPLKLRSDSTPETVTENGLQMAPCPKPPQAGKTGIESDPRDTAARLENIGRLFARCRAAVTRKPAPKIADEWRHRRPPAVLTPTLSGWC